jgi:hypothetical protein
MVTSCRRYHGHCKCCHCRHCTVTCTMTVDTTLSHVLSLWTLYYHISQHCRNCAITCTINIKVRTLQAAGQCLAPVSLRQFQVPYLHNKSSCPAGCDINVNLYVSICTATGHSTAEHSTPWHAAAQDSTGTAQHAAAQCMLLSRLLAIPQLHQHTAAATPSC